MVGLKQHGTKKSTSLHVPENTAVKRPAVREEVRNRPVPQSSASRTNPHEYARPQRQKGKRATAPPRRNDGQCVAQNP